MPRRRSRPPPERWGLGGQAESGYLALDRVKSGGSRPRFEWGMMMNLWKSIFAIPALCVAVAACESNPKFKEDMLASSGFKQVPPTTAAQQASLRSLPPHKLVQTTRK